ncbi:MAG: hypothetical protein U1E76_22125 [Planctomycetota bacterium]
MTSPGDPMREQLLAHSDAAASDLERHRRTIDAELEHHQRGLRREQLFLRFLWPALVLMATVFLVIAARHAAVPLGTFFGIQACFWVLFGAIELIKHFVNRARVEILRDVRRVQLDVAELRAELAQRNKETS